MSLGDSIVSILEKLSTLKIAAPAALSSFILFVLCLAGLFVLRIDQFFQLEVSSPFELILKTVSILTSNTPSEIITGLYVLLITFVCSCCFLIFSFLRDIKEALKKLSEEAGKYLKKLIRLNNQQLAQAREAKYILSSLSSEHIQILNLFKGDKGLIEIGEDFERSTTELVERYQLIEAVSEVKSNEKQLYRLNRRYDFFVRHFIRGALKNWIYDKEERARTLNSWLTFHSFLHILFDVIFYVSITALVAFIIVFILATLLGLR